MSGPNYNINWEGIHIPRLKVQVGEYNLTTKSHDIILSLEGIGNRTFLELKPRVFMFMFKPKRRSQAGTLNERYKAAGFYHPVDANAATTHGANAKFYGGSRRDVNGAVLPTRNTEWPLTITAADERQIITNLEPEKYYSIQSPTIFPRRTLELTDLPLGPSDQIFLTGAAWSNQRKLIMKNLVMKFAIGVKNPDPKPGENPWIFGPMSDELMTRIDAINGERFVHKIGGRKVGGY